jgi:hypothetical protein
MLTVVTLSLGQQRLKYPAPPAKRQRAGSDREVSTLDHCAAKQHKVGDSEGPQQTNHSNLNKLKHGHSDNL